MRVYDLRNAQGEIYAFEISNCWISRVGVAHIAGRIPGARMVRTPRYFSWHSPDEFCEFTVDGVLFAAWEPFGDSSRYWIGPKPARPVSELSVVRAAFVAA